MLNPFPIQFLALFAYFILRVFVGGILIHLGLRHSRRYHELVSTTNWPFMPQSPLPIMLLISSEFLLGLCILIGAHTQIVALCVIALSFTLCFWHRRFTAPDALPPRIFYTLLIGACLSLFITSAGVFAFDLPI